MIGVTIKQSGNHDAMQVIINADDLGMDTRTNELVFELMLDNKITSATIMANGSACENAVAQHKNFTHCSFGAHLNLTTGKPLSKTRSLLPILDSDGLFSGLESLVCAKKNINLIKGIYNELALQIEKLLSLGVEISHIDSHQHIHNLPVLFPVIKLLQKNYNLRRIRLSKNLYHENSNTMRSLKKMMFNYFLTKFIKSYSTDIFTGLDTFYAVGRVRTIQKNSIELMVHLRDYDEGWSDYKMLQTPWQNNLVFPIELIPYTMIWLDQK